MAGQHGLHKRSIYGLCLSGMFRPTLRAVASILSSAVRSNKGLYLSKRRLCSRCDLRNNVAASRSRLALPWPLPRHNSTIERKWVLICLLTFRGVEIDNRSSLRRPRYNMACSKGIIGYRWTCGRPSQNSNWSRCRKMVARAICGSRGLLHCLLNQALAICQIWHYVR